MTPCLSDPLRQGYYGQWPHQQHYSLPVAAGYRYSPPAWRWPFFSASLKFGGFVSWLIRVIDETRIAPAVGPLKLPWNASEWTFGHSHRRLPQNALPFLPVTNMYTPLPFSYFFPWGPTEGAFLSAYGSILIYRRPVELSGTSWETVWVCTHLLQAGWKMVVSYFIPSLIYQNHQRLGLQLGRKTGPKHLLEISGLSYRAVRAEAAPTFLPTFLPTF